MDIEQFKSVVLPLQNQFYRYAFWLTKDSDDAEDLAQETMIRMWNMGAKLGKYQNFLALGNRITKNLFIDNQRKRSRETALADDLEIIDNHSASDLQLMLSEGERTISELIERLSPVQQEILYLRNVEQKSIKEIAEIVRMKPNTIEVTLSRLRRNLREQYLKIQNYENRGS